MRRYESTTTCNNRPAATEISLPEAPELERAILGALILEPSLLPDVADILTAGAFCDQTNSQILDTMLSMLAEGATIDLYTLSLRCKELPNIERPAAYLAGLTSAVGSGANLLDHARQLREIENCRRLVLLGNELAARAASGDSMSEDTAEWIGGQLATISDASARTADLVAMDDAVRTTLSTLEQRQQARQRGGCVGVATGLQRLDALTGGWRGGQLIVLAGRPAMGKSAVMLHFARSAAASGVPVCVYSLEMPTEQLIGRMLVGASGVDAGAFRTGEVDALGWLQLERAGSDLAAMPVFLNDRANLSMRSVRSQSKAMRRRDRCGMVVVDYLQLLDTTTANRNDTREREIAAASRSAKLLAKELDVPVILLSQLSRKVEDRADKTPLLSDLRESGAIEQDADMVIFIDRPAMYGIQTITTSRYGIIPTEGVGRLIVAKNRDGAIGNVYFRHNSSMTRIYDYGNPEENSDAQSDPF